MPTIVKRAVVFAEVAPRLVTNGYPVVPCVQHEKRPILSHWLAYQYKAGDYPTAACGIITGRGLVAVDIDILDENAAADTRDLIMDIYGDTIYRVGQAPKTLLVYRAPAGLRKARIDVAHGQIELLGDGQQFVAYGFHKSTHKPYTWPGVLGGPLEVAAEQLPLLSMQDLQRLLEMLGKNAAPAHALQSDVFELNKPPIGVSMEDMAENLAVLDCHARDSWLRTGMALHHEYAGSEAALSLWEDWSRGSDKFREGECQKLWSDFGQHAGERVAVTARSLLREAHVLRDAAKADAARAALVILQSDLDTCTDVGVLTGSLARAIREADLTEGMRIQIKQAFAKRYRHITGEKITKAQVIALTDPRGKITHELTEVGNAARMVEAQGKNLMYCPETTAWYRWDGGRWLSCVGEIVMRMAANVVADISKEAEGQPEATASDLYKWQKVSSKAAMLDNMVKITRISPTVMVSAIEMDADTELLGCTNGNVHVPTGTLIPPERRVSLTLNTNLPYDENATCPLFERTVREAFFGDVEMVSFLQRVIGYALLGVPAREEIMVMPEGKGANGKSTIFNAIYHALGGYARYAAAETFVGVKGQNAAGAPREDVLRLRGARFVYVTELDEGGVLREAFVKAMTGGESMPARGLHAKHTIEVSPTWVSVMPTNHLPIIKGEDKGIWRRIVVIPFHRDFTADPTIQRDTDRKFKLRNEAPGILRWCVRGAAAYLREGLNPPRKVAAAADKYRGEMDVLSDWLAVSCDTGAEYSATNAELWASWKAFSEREGNDRIIRSASALTRRLDVRGFDRIRSKAGRGFRGLRIKDVNVF